MASTNRGPVQGILISAHAKTGSQSPTRSLDSREPQSQIEQSGQLLHTLAESAQQHKAKGSEEPDVIGAKKEDKPKQLSNEQALHAATDNLSATDKRGQGAQGEGNGSATTTGGGTGAITAWSRPDLVIAAPGGIGAFTPATAIVAAGNTMTLVAGQDLQFAVQGNHAVSIRSGLSLYTYGKASNAAKPNQETGIALHAASGNVRVEAQSDAVKLTADKSIEVASTNGMVKITAPNHILLTAAGAALDIQAGSITLKGPGMIEFRASMKNLTGPETASQAVALKKPGKLERFNEAFQVKDEKTGMPLPFLNYRIEREDGSTEQGRTDAEGRTQRVGASKAEKIKLFIVD